MKERDKIMQAFKLEIKEWKPKPVSFFDSLIPKPQKHKCSCGKSKKRRK